MPYRRGCWQPMDAAFATRAASQPRWVAHRSSPPSPLPWSRPKPMIPAQPSRSSPRRLQTKAAVRSFHRPSRPCCVLQHLALSRPNPAMLSLGVCLADPGGKAWRFFPPAVQAVRGVLCCVLGTAWPDWALSTQPRLSSATSWPRSFPGLSLRCEPLSLMMGGKEASHEKSRGRGFSKSMARHFQAGADCLPVLFSSR